MKVEFIRPFMTAAMQVLEAELGSKVKRGELSVEDERGTTQDVTVLIGITGDVEGVVLYGTSTQVANAIVSRLLGMEKEEFDPLSESAFAELGNVIAGRAAGLFEEEGIHCTISPPSVITGTKTCISSPSLRRLVIPLETDLGAIQMSVALRDRRPASKTTS